MPDLLAALFPETTKEEEFIVSLLWEFLVAIDEAKDDAPVSALVAFLQKHKQQQLIDDINACMSKKALRTHFKYFDGLGEDPPRQGNRLYCAKHRQRIEVLRLFPPFLQRRAADGLARYTRWKLREESFLRRIMPPTILESSSMESYSSFTETPIKFPI